VIKIVLLYNCSIVYFLYVCACVCVCVTMSIRKSISLQCLDPVPDGLFIADPTAVDVAEVFMLPNSL